MCPITVEWGLVTSMPQRFKLVRRDASLSSDLRLVTCLIPLVPLQHRVSQSSTFLDTPTVRYKLAIKYPFSLECRRSTTVSVDSW